MSPHKIQTFQNEVEFQGAAVDFLSDRLREGVKGNAKTTLFLSGGSTPGPIYSRLSKQRLAWSRIAIAQVDERWVGLKNPGSNAALLHKTMLKNNAEKAKFVRMKSRHGQAAGGQDVINDKYETLTINNSVAVLGMGMDGHVCSWFPGANGTNAAMDPSNDNLVQAVLAKHSKVTGPYLERMTLTLSALQKCGSVLLLIKGEDKKTLMQKAIKSRPQSLPVTHLLNGMGAPLTIMCAG